MRAVWTEANRRLLYQTWRSLPRGLTTEQMVDAIWQRIASVTGATRKQVLSACQRMRLNTAVRVVPRRLTPEIEAAIRQLHAAGYKDVEIVAIFSRHDVRDGLGDPIEPGFVRRVLRYYLEVPT